MTLRDLCDADLSHCAVWGSSQSALRAFMLGRAVVDSGLAEGGAWWKFADGSRLRWWDAGLWRVDLREADSA